MRRAIIAGLAALSVLLPATAAAAQDGSALDRQQLRRTLEAVHEAGMYGTYSHVVDGRQSWRGAAGIADVETGRPVHPGLVHRVGSITKTFTAVAVLQQVGKGTIDLDAPVDRYLPGLIQDGRGRQITARMLLNHTSHISDYDHLVFQRVEDVDAHRFRVWRPEELVSLALAAPATGRPGVTPGEYSNTNYLIAGLLLEKVTGVKAERYITDHVIRKAGLRHTSFPRTPYLPGPHSRAYEGLNGLIDPPRDYSVYDPSIAWTAGAIVSTMADLNRFYRLLLRGELLDARLLAEMQRTVPLRAGDGTSGYGLGLVPADLPCGRFWGHEGGVFGMTTVSVTSADGDRQLSIGFNLTGYQRVDEGGNPVPHPIDAAVAAHAQVATCGAESAPAAAAGTAQPFPRLQLDRMPIER
ncbi:serine hydrolase domain-containing protein [Nonomuraea gerenzanensis]|uniref:D-alanyl-D-alanine carboxypeptidase n=1 Tax=Nonomuraea gerenzanensis TaxID=93944 RepID=A0A1M4EEH7_9ACTN|nr:serine hydrolase domain-containing protein [Nonomuraea gerenzanensis]UBU08623.1 beta-lactamase family protein [Nonomuraea gerenzanensis]SBO96983.1 D-alanyl-D-alanine carboxypeptidase [Nonomuraea gerenzanensis]